MNSVTVNLQRGTLSLARQIAVRYGLRLLWEKGLGEFTRQLIDASPIPRGEIPPAQLVQKVFRSGRRLR